MKVGLGALQMFVCQIVGKTNDAPNIAGHHCVYSIGLLHTLPKRASKSPPSF